MSEGTKLTRTKFRDRVVFPSCISDASSRVFDCDRVTRYVVLARWLSTDCFGRGRPAKCVLIVPTQHTWHNQMSRIDIELL